MDNAASDPGASVRERRGGSDPSRSRVEGAGQPMGAGESRSRQGMCTADGGRVSEVKRGRRV